MNVKDLIELLRALPKGSKIALQRKEFEALFRDSDPGRRAGQIARLNGCDLTVDDLAAPAGFGETTGAAVCQCFSLRGNDAFAIWPH